jgi:DNA (cytosine-5)-methyltransferase 1
VSRAAPFTYYEFFAGGGMARLGLGARWNCLFANDFDPIKSLTYRDNFGEDHFVEGDVWGLEAGDLPGRADLAWASSPCQDFSLAGARAGLAGGRSSAFFGFWRLVEALNREGRAPRLVAVENVTGLLTSHGGADFRALCQGLADQGYRFGSLEIDAAGFLPQSRRRVLIVGVRGAAPNLPGAQGPVGAIAKAYAALPPALQDAWLPLPTPGVGASNATLASLLEPDGAVAWRPAVETRRLLGLMDARNRAKVDAAVAGGERRVGAVFRRVREAGQRAEVRFDGLAGCLRTPRGGSSRQSILVVEGGRVRSRLITPREAARLMGLPEDYRLPGRATNALMIAGDGVAVPVVRWLAQTILEPLLAPAPAAMAAE